MASLARPGASVISLKVGGDLKIPLVHLLFSVTGKTELSFSIGHPEKIGGITGGREHPPQTFHDPTAQERFGRGRGRMGVVASGAGNSPLMIKGKVFRDITLGPDIHRVGHAVDHRMTITAQADNIFDEPSTCLDRFGFVTVEALGRLIHESVGAPCSRCQRGHQEEEHQKSAKDSVLSFC
jgi:hypothetical protein